MGKIVTFGFIFLFLVITASVFAYEFCEDGVVGSKNLRLISVDDMLNQNSIEWTWEPEETVEIEARVENKDSSSNNYVLEVIFVNEDGNTVDLAKDDDDLEVDFSLSSGERESILINFEVNEDIDEDDYDMYVKMYKHGDEDLQCVENEKETVTIDKVELCEDGNVKARDLEITDITDEEKDNDDKWEWSPGNDIEISLKLENKDYSERNFVVELIMLDENNEEITFAKDKDNLKEESTIDEGDDDIFNFDFEIRNELDAGSYTFYAKAYAEDDGDICTSLRAEDADNRVVVNINRVNKKVIVTKVVGPTESETNAVLTYTATVTNMGSKSEEKVAVIAYNRLLGIREVIEINNLDTGEEQSVEFKIEIPLIAKLAIHKILFSTEYEYDEKVEHFRSSSDEDDDKKIILTLTQGEFEEEVENETGEVENETEKVEINETLFEEEMRGEEEVPGAVITGNVVGKTSKPINWFGILVFIVLAGVGVFLFLKKPKILSSLKKTKPYGEEPIVTPNVTRRYTARLN
ncbi:hypothetical protein KAS08_01210 [Candidatus Pacearchaeota archaeon]|nr:hypothetical protein [Candidatus Pacearchaeota archaeon]